MAATTAISIVFLDAGCSKLGSTPGGGIPIGGLDGSCPAMAKESEWLRNRANRLSECHSARRLASVWGRGEGQTLTRGSAINNNLMGGYTNICLKRQVGQPEADWMGRYRDVSSAAEHARGGHEAEELGAYATLRQGPGTVCSMCPYQLQWFKCSRVVGSRLHDHPIALPDPPLTLPASPALRPYPPVSP